MPPTSSRIARLLAAVGAAVAFAATPIAVAPFAIADPSDGLPLCQGDESPQEDNCSTGCPDDAPLNSDGTCAQPGTQDITGGPADNLGTDAPGADPGVPSGSLPDDVAYGPSAEH